MASVGEAISAVPSDQVSDLRAWAHGPCRQHCGAQDQGIYSAAKYRSVQQRRLPGAVSTGVS
eukprot:45196-Eustigmatos_ZCMA.PRE.1